MELDCVETVKIKIRVNDSILFIEKVKENLSEVSSRRDPQQFFSRLKTHTLARNNSAVRIKAKVNDIGVAYIYPGADVKNGVRAGFVHDKNIPAKIIQCQLCASRPVCVKGCRQKAQEILVGDF